MIQPTYTNHPLLRIRGQKKASVSFSELLFDLIYVFAVTQLSHYLLHNLTWIGFLQQVILWFAIWLAWQHTVWFTNWFNPDKRQVRILLFSTMIVGLIMTSSIPNAFTDRGLIFAGCYVVMQIGRTLFILLTLGRKHQISANYERIFGWFCITAIFWIVGAFHEGYTRMLFWAIAVLLDYTSPMFGFYLPILGRSDSSKEWTIDGHHLAERCQLFVIIAFGEIILMTGSSLSDIENWNFTIVFGAIASFVGCLAMWWVYFDVSSEAGSRKIQKASNPGLLGLKYHSVHVILVGAIIISAVGNEIVVSHPEGHNSIASIFTLIVGPIVYLIANSVYKWMTCQSFAYSHLAGILLLLLIIPFSGSLNLLTVNIMVTLVFIIVILIEYRKPQKDKLSIEED